MNKFDIELFEYIKSLAALRLKEMNAIIDLSAHKTGQQCSAIPMTLLIKSRESFGVFQPPGHKGP